MSDYDSIVDSMGAESQGLATTSIDKNPDEGAKALQLSRQTGVSPYVIHNDVEGFTNQYKAKLASDLIKDNGQLDAYIRGNPLADVVSNDDYGNLHEFSEKAGYLSQVHSALRGFEYLPGYHIIKSAIDSYSEPMLRLEDVSQEGMTGALARSADVIAKTARVPLVAPFAGTGEWVKKVVWDITDDQNLANRWSRTIMGIAESEMGRGGGHGGEMLRAGFEKQTIKQGIAEALGEMYDRAKPWIDADLEPPKGVHPYIDQIKAHFNDEFVKQLQEVLTQGEGTATKARDPELFSNFVKQHFENGSIGISGDRVAALYGDKVPEPGDGLLGWVPGIQEKLAAAKATGDDVHVSIADWLANVDPAVAKDLHDDIRAWPGGITKTEAKEPFEYKPAVDSPMAQVRANGLEPAFAIGDRKLELRKLEENPATEGFHQFAFVDQNGKEIGSLELFPDPTKKQLYVSMVQGLAGLYSNSFGPSLIRDLKRQLKEMYPEYETITGHRVTGARYSDAVLESKAREYAARDGKEYDTLDQGSKDSYRQDALANFDNPTDHPVVKLSLDDLAGLPDLHKLLDETYKRQFAHGIEAQIWPTKLWLEHEHEANRIISEELQRIAPGVEAVATHEIRNPSENVNNIRGVYLGGMKPQVLFSLLDPEALGIARHEAIHHLYRNGLFLPEEWNALVQASIDNNWRERYGIDRRYAEHGLDEMSLHEEAIAEAFREWSGQRDKVPDSLVTRAFQRIWDYLAAVKDRMMKEFGWSGDVHDLFEKVNSGEVGGRKAAAGEGKPAFALSSDEPPIPKGMSRLYHGSALHGRYDGKAWFSTNKEYARNYRPDAELQYVDVSTDWLNSKADPDGYGQTPDKGFTYNVELDSTETGPRKPIKQNSLSPEDYAVKLDNLRAESVGLDLRSWRKMQKLIQDRFAEDLDAAMRRAEREQKREQTKEWKEQARDVRKEVEETIQQRPDVAADLFVGGGIFNGTQLEKRRYPLRAEDLTPEQQAGLPRHYYSKDGLPVDAVASLLGYPSGDAFVAKLSEYNAAKEGRTVQEQLKKVIDDETQRQMEAKFGKLDESIMSEARDQALSETNLNILAEEWQGAAMQAGVEVVDKDFAKQVASQLFSQMKVGEIDRQRLMNVMLKHGRDAERALIAGKPADAVMSMERKYMTGLMAAEAMKLEKEQKSFDRTARQFQKREVPSVEAEYTNFIHDILQRVGKPVRRSIQDVAKEIEAGVSKNLKDFVEYKSQQFRVMPVWEELFDSNWRKGVPDMTVDEFRAVKSSIDTLVHNGRDEKKLIRQGEAEDFAELKQRLIDGVVGSAHDEVAVQNRGKLAKLPKTFFVNHLQMENILGRWDRFDSQGPWTQYVLRDLIDGVNQGDVWRTEYAKKLRGLGTPKDINRTIENTLFKDPDTGAVMPFTRKNLLTVMLNMGNDYNMNRIAKGYGLEVGEVQDWVHRHATPEEWKFVQGVWDVFADAKAKSDTMYRSLSGGIAPKSVDPRPVLDPYGREVAKGGYYPIIFHPEIEGKSKKLMGPDALMMDNFTNTLPSSGYTKDRTGYVAPLALEMDMMTNKLAQVLHDTATRPAIINASKVFKDPEIRSAIRKHFGVEYRDELLDYLRSVANSQNYIPQNQKLFTAASEFIRQNMITTLVGLNPGTVMKHGPTALGLSMKEVGLMQFGKAFGEVAGDSFMHWTRSLFNLNEGVGETNWQFAVKNSLELQRRDRNWQESLFGVEAGLNPGDKFAPWRQRIMEWSSKPVALSDMISAVPTWLAKYHEMIEDGASHGDAVFEADRSVRRAHGSTAATNRTAMQRNVTPWLTSIYNFWSEIMNRQVETIWKAGEAAKMTEGGTLAKGMATVPVIAGGMMAYVIWPAIVESFVSPEDHEDHDPWAKKAAKQLTFTLGSSWVGIRDAVSALTHGRDPQYGLAGTAGRAFTDVVRDFNKTDAFSRDRRGKFLRDAGMLIGAATGALPAQISKGVQFGHDVAVGKEHPRNVWQWLVGARYGTTDKHSKSFEDYMKGKYK